MAKEISLFLFLFFSALVVSNDPEPTDWETQISAPRSRVSSFRIRNCHLSVCLAQYPPQGEGIDKTWSLFLWTISCCSLGIQPLWLIRTTNYPTWELRWAFRWKTVSFLWSDLIRSHFPISSVVRARLGQPLRRAFGLCLPGSLLSCCCHLEEEEMETPLGRSRWSRERRQIRPEGHFLRSSVSPPTVSVSGCDSSICSLSLQYKDFFFKKPFASCASSFCSLPLAMTSCSPSG